MKKSTDCCKIDSPGAVRGRFSRGRATREGGHRLHLELLEHRSFPLLVDGKSANNRGNRSAAARNGTAIMPRARPPTDDQKLAVLELAELIRQYMKVGHAADGRHGKEPRLWTADSLAAQIGAEKRTVEYWVGKPPITPGNACITQMMRAFFGDNPAYQQKRRAFFTTFQRTKGILPDPDDGVQTGVSQMDQGNVIDDLVGLSVRFDPVNSAPGAWDIFACLAFRIVTGQEPRVAGAPRSVSVGLTSADLRIVTNRSCDIDPGSMTGDKPNRENENVVSHPDEFKIDGPAAEACGRLEGSPLLDPLPCRIVKNNHRGTSVGVEVFATHGAYKIPDDANPDGSKSTSHDYILNAILAEKYGAEAREFRIASKSTDLGGNPE